MKNPEDTITISTQAAVQSASATISMLITGMHQVQHELSDHLKATYLPAGSRTFHYLAERAKIYHEQTYMRKRLKKLAVVQRTLKQSMKAL